MAHLPQQISEHAPVELERERGRFDIPHGPLQVRDMCRAFRISRATFYRWEKRGVFAQFEILPVVGAKRWNGIKVARWVRGEAHNRPIFGRKSA